MGSNESIRHYLVELPIRGDDRGNLVALEVFKDIPFEVKRVFYIFDTDRDVIRGEHANIDSKFAFVSVAGACSVEINDGAESVEYILDKPNKVLIVDKMLWKTMKHFSNDNVLMVISDCVYNKEEYIYDYEEYKKISGEVIA